MQFVGQHWPNLFLNVCLKGSSLAALVTEALLTRSALMLVDSACLSSVRVTHSLGNLLLKRQNNQEKTINFGSSHPYPVRSVGQVVRVSCCSHLTAAAIVCSITVLLISHVWQSPRLQVALRVPLKDNHRQMQTPVICEQSQ